MECLKKTGLFLFSLYLVVSLFCSSPAFASERLKIVCTFFPVYLFTRKVVENQPNVSVELLIPPTMGCPHDYALTPGDLRKISQADLIVANGLGMETFLFSAGLEISKKLPIVNAAQGFEPNRTYINHEDFDHSQDKSHLSNPHLFASPRMAVVYINNIEKALSLADPDKTELYKKNSGQFILHLKELERSLKNAVTGAANKKVVILHDSLEYLVRDAGLEVAEVIHSDKKLFPKEIIRLARRIKKSRPVAIFTDPQYSSRMVEMLSRETGVAHYILDPMASGGEYNTDYYVTVMQRNVEILKRALGN